MELTYRGWVSLSWICSIRWFLLTDSDGHGMFSSPWFTICFWRFVELGTQTSYISANLRWLGPGFSLRYGCNGLDLPLNQDAIARHQPGWHDIFRKRIPELKPSYLPMITSRVGGTIDEVIMVLAAGPPKKTSSPDFSETMGERSKNGARDDAFS